SLSYDFFFFQAEDGIRDPLVTGVQTCALPILVLPISLGTFFNDYTTARLTGNFTSPVLAGTLPTEYGILDVGETSGAVPGGSLEIGRASCRERGEVSVRWGAVRKEDEEDSECR